MVHYYNIGFFRKRTIHFYCLLVVEDILQKSKPGEKDVAEFWLHINDNFVLIRYFAMRDDEGNYVGTLEVSQELSRLRSLEGERRLVQWGD